MRPLTTVRIAPIAIIVAVGSLLAALGVVEGVDSIVWYVFAIVDQIGSDPWSILKPVYNPPPMYTHAYRPLSAALTKLGSAAFGRGEVGLQLQIFTHGLFLVGYGLAARRCLSVHGFSPESALLAALTAMATPTVLFSAWTIPEFDMIGGAIVLMAASELRMGRMRRALPWLALAILTKETTAVIALMWLLVRAIQAFRATGDTGPARLAAGYLGVLLVAVWPILRVEPEVTHAFSVVSEGFEPSRAGWLAFHNASQVLYVIGPVGALLLGLLGLRRSPLHATGLKVSAAAAGLLLVGPFLRYYNHYESIIFDQMGWVLLWCLVALGGLVALARYGTTDERLLALVIGAAFCGLLAGPLLASFSRADLSARLYAPLIPVLYALAFRGAAVGTHRRVGLVLAACVVWQGFAGAFNSAQFHHARFPLETIAKRQLIAGLQPGCPWVYYTNCDQELAVEELALLGGLDESVLSCLRLIQLEGTSLGPGDLWEQRWGLQGYDHRKESEQSRAVTDSLSSHRPSPVPVHLYVQLARSRMTAEQNRWLVPDFEWATHRMPEAHTGCMEQAVGMPSVADTPLERTFDRLAHSTSRERVEFYQLPLWLHEAPRRLLLGLPLLEPWWYQATLNTVRMGEPLPPRAP